MAHPNNWLAQLDGNDVVQAIREQNVQVAGVCLALRRQIQEAQRFNACNTQGASRPRKNSATSLCAPRMARFTRIRDLGVSNWVPAHTHASLLDNKPLQLFQFRNGLFERAANVATGTRHDGSLKKSFRKAWTTNRLRPDVFVRESIKRRTYFVEALILS